MSQKINPYAKPKRRKRVSKKQRVADIIAARTKACRMKERGISVCRTNKEKNNG